MLKFFMINNGLEQTRQKIINFDRYIYLLQDSAIRQPGTRIKFIPPHNAGTFSQL